jgi:hypothetical protein
MSPVGEMSGLIDRLKEARLPVCPRIRGAHGKWLSPVDGYCVLACQPGCMIPSPDEFRSYCTTARYSECPWFNSRSRPLGDRGGIRRRPDALAAIGAGGSC